MSHVPNRPYWESVASDEGPDRARKLPADSYDFVVVGGGIVGLWAALHLRNRAPEASIAVFEAERIGHHASGRNAGMLTSNLSWSYADILKTMGEEKAGAMARAGHDNALSVVKTIQDLGVDCDLQETDLLVVSTHPGFDRRIERELTAAERLGVGLESLNTEQVQARIASPVLTCGYAQRGGLVNPFKLVRGLAVELEARGVEIFECAAVGDIRPVGDGCEIETPQRTVRARRVFMSRNAWAVKDDPNKPQVQPVYTYGAVTARLSDRQWSELGWERGEGAWDRRALMYSFRPTPDGRILFAGAENRFPFGSRRLTGRRFDPDVGTTRALREGFDLVFPQLSEVPFEMTWGGLIATTPEHIPKTGIRHEGRVAFSHGCIGHSLAPGYLTSEAAVDLLLGEETDRTRMLFDPENDPRFPPEPLRWIGSRVTFETIRYDDYAMQHGRPPEKGSWPLRILNRILGWFGVAGH